MAKRAKRIELFGKAGCILSIISIIGVSVAFVVMLQKWNFQENVIVLGTIRKPVVMITLFFAVISGFLGFLGGLEGASEGEGKTKTLGWIGFWIGMTSTMTGIILGLCFWFYKF